jgi:hypothetical protein
MMPESSTLLDGLVLDDFSSFMFLLFGFFSVVLLVKRFLDEAELFEGTIGDTLLELLMFPWWLIIALLSYADLLANESAVEL